MSPPLDLLEMSPELAEDSAAVMAHLIDHLPLDPSVRRRVRARAAQIKEAVRRQHGLVDIAVPAIRELRDA